MVSFMELHFLNPLEDINVLLLYFGIISLRLIIKVLDVSGVRERNQIYVLLGFLFICVRCYKQDN